MSGTNPNLPLPLFASAVSAGFPSPAEDYLDRALDLNEHLIQNPASTFFVRVAGDSMLNAGIFPGDLLIVDKSLSPRTGQVVIATIDGELTVKRLEIYENRTILRPENPNYQPIILSRESPCDIWGVVTYVIHAP